MLRTLPLLILTTGLAMGAAPFAQAQDTPAAPAAAPATPPAAAAAPAQESKRDGCRKEVQSKGLRGMDRMDAMQICMAEGRLDCVKQAVAQKMPMKERKDFIKTCAVGK